MIPVGPGMAIGSQKAEEENRAWRAGGLSAGGRVALVCWGGGWVLGAWSTRGLPWYWLKGSGLHGMSDTGFSPWGLGTGATISGLWILSIATTMSSKSWEFARWA